MVELDGTWLAAPADEDLRRAYPATDFDDASWRRLDVPGAWPAGPPMLLRHRFTTATTPEGDGEGERSWLTFDGVHDQADVWLDGGYVGDLEGAFVPHTFEVTEQLAAAGEHVLAMEVTAAPGGDGGVARPVTIHRTGPVAIRTLRVLCLEATAERALLSFDASIDAREAVDASFLTTVGLGTEHHEEQRLAAGTNRVEWRVAVEAPPLWWPHALGAADLMDVAVAVHLDDRRSDRRALRTGMRQVRLRNWIATVNGERLFLKSAPLEASGDPERDVLQARDAGLDALRVRGRVAEPELYDAADRHGLLLWQDVPLPWGWARGVRRRSASHAAALVDALGHRPSVFAWCTPEGGGLQRAVEKHDRSRATVAMADAGEPSAAAPATTATAARDLARVAALWPSAVRFRTSVTADEVDTLRRLKYRPSGGFLLGEPAPCAPVAVVADRPEPAYAPGEAIALDVHVVNDLRTELVGMVVRARLSWPGGGHTWAWTGTAPPDSCVLVGTVQATVPDVEGPLTLELTLAGDGTKAENRYESEVRR